MRAEPSTLAILVPEAEKLVGSYRARYDRSGAEGMPAHITMLWPFKPVSDVTAEVRADLEAIATAHTAFRFTLPRIARFELPALYLAPEPEEPFRALMHDIWTKYPEHPPYGGMYEHNPPHLTVA